MVKCPYCDQKMKTTGRTHKPGIEYKCLNCQGVWIYVEKPNFKILDKKNGIIKNGGIFYPVLYPRVLADILLKLHLRKVF